jgi:hypothetical protein
MSHLYVIQYFLSSPAKHIDTSLRILPLSHLRQSISLATISLPATHLSLRRPSLSLSLSPRVAHIIPFVLFQFLTQRSLGNGRKMNKISLSLPCAMNHLIFQLISLIDLYMQKAIERNWTEEVEYLFAIEIRDLKEKKN